MANAPPAAWRWMPISILSGLVGGVLLILIGLALLTVLSEAEFERFFVDQLGSVAMILLAFALPALYVSEREWFGRLATIGFGLLSVGWIVAAVGLTVGTFTMPPVSETAFLGFILGLLVATIGMLVFGVAMVRTDTTTAPRISAWLLIAALPIGVPFAIGFTTYVMVKVPIRGRARWYSMVSLGLSSDATSGHIGRKSPHPRRYLSKKTPNNGWTWYWCATRTLRTNAATRHCGKPGYRARTEKGTQNLTIIRIRGLPLPDIELNDYSTKKLL